MTTSRPPDNPQEDEPLSQTLEELEQSILADERQNPRLARYLVQLRRHLETEIERRDRILEGVNIACTRLIRARDWQSEIEDILLLLGKASDADRTAIFRLYRKSDERLYASLRFAWDRSGLDLKAIPSFQEFDVYERGFGPAIEQLNLAKTYYFQRSERSPEKILAQDTETTLIIPLFSNSLLWGGIGFYMTRASRDWTAPECNALQIAADMLSAIIERQETEQQLREYHYLKLALEKEQELNNLKTRVMRTVSHEFRTPLSIILTSNSILQRYLDRLSVEKCQEKLEVIESQVKHLDRLVGEVSSAVHEMFDQHVFHPRFTNLETLCRTNFDEMQRTLGSHHPMHFISDGTLTSAFVDERLVHRILINLLSNAIKYSPEGQDITLRLSVDGEIAVIEVKDLGIGIPVEEQAHLFAPFFRASNVGETQGTGLGLNIVHDCVEHHQGQLMIESEIGKGTTFTVRLPITPS